MGTKGDGNGKHYVTKQQANGTDVVDVTCPGSHGTGTLAAELLGKATCRTGEILTAVTAAR